MQPALNICNTLREVEQSITELCASMDLRLYQFLGLGEDSSIHLWRQTFVGRLLEDNHKYRLDVLRVLQMDATRFRTTDFMSITSEDFDDVAYMASKLQSQTNELFSVCQALIQGSTSTQQVRLEAILSYHLDSLLELGKREALLRQRFSELSPLLRILALPEDRFTLLTDPFRELVHANGHPRIDDFTDELDQLREQRRQIQSTVSALIKDASEKDIMSTEEKYRLLKEVNEIRECTARQASTEAKLAHSVMTFREDTAESPNIIYAEDGSTVAVRDLLSVTQDYMELEQEVIELHRAQLDWHLFLLDSLDDLHALTDILEMTSVLVGEVAT